MSIFERAKKLEIFIIIAIVGVFGAVYALTKDSAVAPDNSSQQAAGQQSGSEQQQQQQNQQSENQDRVQLVPGSTVSYQGQNGRTALELLKQSHRVDTKQTSFGEMVIGIDGVGVDESKQYWAFYVDGKLAPEGAGTYKTKSTEKIEWRIESL